jgi:tetratricopeptide (TPR) repeat protein
LGALERQLKLIGQRDDLSVSLAELYNQTGQPQKALEILASRQFHAWEGGEGGAAGQYALAHIMLGMYRAGEGILEAALAHFKMAQDQPDNLGLRRGMSLYDAVAWFKTAETLFALGRPDEAHEYYQKLIMTENGMALWGARTPLTYYAARSQRALGQLAQANDKLQELQDFAQKKLEVEDESGFFTSRPITLVFDDDPRITNQIEGHYLMGLAQLGLGNERAAEASFRSVLAFDPHHWWAQFQLANR